MKNQEELLEIWLKGDRDAINLVGLIGSVSQTWDDLVDGDKQLTLDDINEMMWGALMEIRRNPFFRKHEAEMDMLLEQAIDSWHEANDLEAEGLLPLVTYTIRSSVTPLLVRMTYLLGGRLWGRKCAREIRLAVFDEPYDEYLSGLRKEAKEA